MHEEAVNRRITLIPHPAGQPYSGRLQLTRNASVAVIDNDTELRIVRLKDQVELFNQRHPRGKDGVHAVVCQGDDVHIVYKDRLVAFDIAAEERRPPMRLRTVATLNPHLAKPVQSSLTFAVSSKSLITKSANDMFYAPFLYSTAPGTAVTLYDGKIAARINLTTGQCNFGMPSMDPGQKHEPANAIAMDEYGQSVLYERDNGDWHFWSRSAKGGPQKIHIPHSEYRDVYLTMGRIYVTFADRFEVWNLGVPQPANPLFNPNTRAATGNSPAAVRAASDERSRGASGLGSGQHAVRLFAGCL